MNILTVATVAGVFGGVYGLISSFLAGSVVISAGSAGSGAAWVGWVAGLLVLAAPIIGIVGAEIVKRKPFVGSGLMAVSSIILSTGQKFQGDNKLILF